MLFLNGTTSKTCRLVSSHSGGTCLSVIELTLGPQREEAYHTISLNSSSFLKNWANIVVQLILDYRTNFTCFNGKRFYVFNSKNAYRFMAVIVVQVQFLITREETAKKNI